MFCEKSTQHTCLALLIAPQVPGTREASGSHILGPGLCFPLNSIASVTGMAARTAVFLLIGRQEPGRHSRSEGLGRHQPCPLLHWMLRSHMFPPSLSRTGIIRNLICRPQWIWGCLSSLGGAAKGDIQTRVSVAEYSLGHSPK